MRTSASRRVQEVTMVQRSSGRLASRLQRTRQRDDTFKVFDLAPLDLAILGLVISVGQIVFNRR